MLNMLSALTLDPVKLRERLADHWGLPLILLGLAYLYLCGYTFQFLYPRMLDEIPWLGTWRRISSIGRVHSFDPELFLRGFGMGLLVWLSLWALYWVLSLLPGSSLRGVWTAQLFALATCLPFGITVLAAWLLYAIHPYWGFLPLYGLFVSACRLSSVLHAIYGLHRFAASWLAPLVFGIQLFGSLRLLP